MSQNTKNRSSRRPARRWTQWKEPQAREALAAWRRSGLSIAEFCKREGHSPARLRYWSQRVGAASVRDQRPAVSFVPVTLGSAQHGHIEIERNGVVLRVREDLDVAHVARLVAALGAGEPAC